MCKLTSHSSRNNFSNPRSDSRVENCVRENKESERKYVKSKREVEKLQENENQKLFST